MGLAETFQIKTQLGPATPSEGRNEMSGLHWDRARVCVVKGDESQVPEERGLAYCAQPGL